MGFYKARQPRLNLAFIHMGMRRRNAVPGLDFEIIANERRELLLILINTATYDVA